MKVRIYTTPVCAYCKMAKDYFVSKNIKYEEISLVGNKEAQQLVMSKTGMVAAPILEINGTYVVGFNREETSCLLDKNMKIVDYAIVHRRSLELKIKDALKILYPDQKATRPYKTWQNKH